MALAPVARQPATFLQGRRQPGIRKSQHREQPEEGAGQQRDRQREHHDDRIDANLVQPGQPLGPEDQEHPQRGRGQRQADRTTDERNRDAFGQQLARVLPPARPERGADGQLTLAPLRAHEKQVRHVGASDQQHQADRAQQHPEHAADVADDILGERPDVRPEPCIVEHGAREARREPIPVDARRNHPGDIGVRLGDRRVGPEPSDPLVAELAGEDLRPHEGPREDQRRLLTEEPEPGRQHTDDFARVAVDEERLADDARVTRELPLPVAVGQQNALGTSGQAVLGPEPLAK